MTRAPSLVPFGPYQTLPVCRKRDCGIEEAASILCHDPACTRTWPSTVTSRSGMAQRSFSTLLASALSASRPPK
eukprot:3776499-Prorocentrum_lima.AAC.1